jgi:hypothetical protein
MDKTLGRGDNGRWVDNSGYPPPNKVVTVESNDFFARNTEIEIPLSSIYVCRNYLKFFVKEI